MTPVRYNVDTMQIHIGYTLDTNITTVNDTMLIHARYVADTLRYAAILCIRCQGDLTLSEQGQTDQGQEAGRRDSEALLRVA